MIGALTTLSVAVCAAAALTAGNPGLFFVFAVAAIVAVLFGLWLRDDRDRIEGDDWYRQQYNELRWDARERRIDELTTPTLIRKERSS